MQLNSSTQTIVAIKKNTCPISSLLQVTSYLLLSYFIILANRIETNRSLKEQINLNEYRCWYGWRINDSINDSGKPVSKIQASPKELE